MAKYDEREGNSCHIHLSLTDADGANLMAGDGPDGMRADAPFPGRPARRPARLLPPYAPNINSYKRFQPGSFAPTAVAWGVDNRTCALRVVGHGPSMRLENRLPGGDVNPHLAVAGLVAAGLHGVEHRLELPDACTGNAYTAGYDQVPTTLREAAELWEASPIAEEAFGEEVVAHYLNMARVELAAYDAAVTDWELRRSFERL
ncbi:glutamine synthetase [Streptomyces californicus]